MSQQQISKYNLRSINKKRKIEEDNVEETAEETATVIPASILSIHYGLNQIIRIALSGAPHTLTEILSDIKYMIGNNSIAYNFKFVAEFCNIGLIVPIKYNISEDMENITIYIIFHKRSFGSNSIYNSFTIILKKYNSINEVSSIVPNVWEWESVPIMHETVGNVFDLNISDVKKDTYIITNINFCKFPMIDRIVEFLNKLLLLNINTLVSPPIHDNYTIKYKFGNILSNFDFIYQWFNIKTIINSSSNMLDENTILFRMILRMNNIKTKISMMHILLKKYSDRVDSIQTNIHNSDNNIRRYISADRIFDYSVGINNINGGIRLDNIWYISRIDFVE
jgi:hypothetical protein